MKYLDMSVKDCEHIRHFLSDIITMVMDCDLGFRDPDGFMYEAAFSDPAYRVYMEITSALCKAGEKLNVLEEIINSEDRKELAS